MAENIKRKTKEEVQAWVADKKRRKGEKVVIADEPTTSTAIEHIKKEVTVL